MTLELFHRLFDNKMFQAQLRDSLHRLIFSHFSRKPWKWKVKVKVVQLCPNLGDSMDCTGVGSLSLLQGIFLIQESNSGILHCRWILYQLSCQRSPSPTPRPWSPSSFKWEVVFRDPAWVLGVFFAAEFILVFYFFKIDKDRNINFNR